MILLGSARASRAGFGATPKQFCQGEVRDGEGAIARTRGVCAPRTQQLSRHGTGIC